MTPSIDELKAVISPHYPHPVFGCECVMEDTDEEGRVKNPVLSWPQHLAVVILDSMGERVMREAGNSEASSAEGG